MEEESHIVVFPGEGLPLKPNQVLEVLRVEDLNLPRFNALIH